MVKRVPTIEATRLWTATRSTKSFERHPVLGFVVSFFAVEWPSFDSRSKACAMAFAVTGCGYSALKTCLVVGGTAARACI